MKKLLTMLLCTLLIVSFVLPVYAANVEQTQETAVTDETVEAAKEQAKEETKGSQPENVTPPADVQCSCDAEEGAAHSESCPLYVPPKNTDGTEETTTPAETEHAGTEPTVAETTETVPSQTDPVTMETVPTETTAPTVPAHIEGCDDKCTGENCECGCHEKSLFERIMACTTLEEIDAVLEKATEEELLALTEEENQKIEEHIVSLEPKPTPAIVLTESEPPVPSEIVYPTVSVTNVAPFRDPVTGGAN